MSFNKPGASKNDDCYFYYYASGCNKGSMCPFRHEPGALAQESVCTFWKQGKCTKTNCIFRHMDLDKKRNVIPCYWEKTTTGCQKAHCPFLHDNPKDSPITEPTVIPNTNPKFNQHPSANRIIKDSLRLVKPMESTATDPLKKTPSKIIVNKNKIEELKSNHVIPESVEKFIPVASKPEISEVANDNHHSRLVLPPKSRLGIKVEINQGNPLRKRSVKERLGSVPLLERSRCEIFELEEDMSAGAHEDADISDEERSLREGAIKTIDLRNRLSKKDSSYNDYIAGPELFNVSEEEPRLKSRVVCALPPMLSDSEAYSDEDFGATSSYVKKSKKSKLKKEKKKKDKNKEHKTSKMKHKKDKIEKAKRKADKKSNIKHKKDIVTAFSAVSPAENITSQNKEKALRKDEYSTLELYMDKIKEKKLKKINSKLIEQSSSGIKKSDEPIQGSLKVAGNKGLPKAQKRKLGNESSNIKIPSKSKSTSTTSGIKRAKILKNISNSVVEKTETVRSILNDVDSLLKSADNQNLLDSNISRQDAIDESEDVMKQLEDIINS